MERHKYARGCMGQFLCRFFHMYLAAEHRFKPPMFFIDRTKAVIQHFLEKSFKYLKIEHKK